MTWEAELDGALVARLVRAGRPGLIGMRVARRIIGAVEQMAGRLPLLARFPRATERSRPGQASETPIVHALPAARGPERPDSGPSSERVVRVVTARTVERERVLERSIERTVERRVDRPIVELAAVPPQVPPQRASNLPGPGAGSPGSAEAIRSSTEPAARRSRMGAPLASSTMPPVVPVVAPVQRSVANAPMSAPPAVLASRRSAGSSTETPLAVIAPRRPASSASGRAAVRPALAAVRPIEIDAASGPIVGPRRSHAPRAEASLAHVAPASAPGPVRAAPRPDAAPSVAPRAAASPAVTPLRAQDAASSIGQPLQRGDLPEIAAQVQRIMARQAQHDRARRGLRR